jgi:hypothetical protein
MAQLDLAVALWNRNTYRKQMDQNPTRLQRLQEAVAACDMQFARVAKPNAAISGIFVAPEYYFAANKAGVAKADGTFYNRCVDEAAKDAIVADLLALSKKFPKMLLIPGTIAWSKSLVRKAGDEFKRDDQNQRTTTKKTTATRMDAVQNSLKGGYNQGGRIPTELLRTKVRRKLLDASPTKTVDPGDVGDEVNRVLYDDVELAKYGAPDTLYRGVPNQADALDLLSKGKVNSIMKNTAFVLLNGKIRFKYSKTNDFHEALSDQGQLIFCPGTKSGFATIEKIDIGIEICLDHAVATLQNTPSPSGQDPLLHVVTSASVEPKHPRARPKGYFIHASSTAEWAGVWQLDGAWKDVAPIESKLLDSDPLDIYKITIDVP